MKLDTIGHLQLSYKRSAVMGNDLTVAEVKGLYPGMANLKAFGLNFKAKRYRFCKEPLPQVFAPANSDGFSGFFIPLCWVERNFKAIMIMFQKAVGISAWSESLRIVEFQDCDLKESGFAAH